MRTPAWLVALWIAPAIPAWADDLPLPDGRAVPVDDPAPRPRERVVPPRSGHSAEPGVPPGSPTEGLWTWVSRLEGAQLVREVTRELQEPKPAPAPSVVQEFVPPPAPGQPIALHLDRFRAQDYDIPVVVNADVERWMTYFLGNGRKHFQRYLDRSGLVEPMMRHELRQAGLPEDLIYLALIESGYNLHAYSEAGAAGLWQFMPGTGRMYDLRVDWWVDDRRDAFKSTRAAVAHLRDLHVMFEGDWLLAWSAYNAGPGRVRKAIAAGGTRDFWRLAAQGNLPSETANYPPKMMAAAIIGHQPGLYGFQVKQVPPLEVDVVRVEGAVSLSVLADCAGLTVEEMQTLNPGLRRSATPAEGYDLNLPRGTFDTFLAALEAVPVKERVHYAHHTVKRGETLGRIAQAHGVTVAEVVAANQLSSADRISVGQALVIPTKAGAEAPVARPPVQGPPAKLVRTVAVEVPASRSRAPAQQAADADLRPSKPVLAAAPVVVERAAVPAPAPAAPAPAAPAPAPTPVIEPTPVSVVLAPDPPNSAPAPAPAPAVVAASAPPIPAPSPTYKVRSGDTLSEIAARHRVSMSELQTWNRISSPSHIQVGQVLRLGPDGSPEASHRVRSGDSLGAIAQAYGCSVAQLRSWNDLGSDVIHPGQVLRVRPTAR